MRAAISRLAIAVMLGAAWHSSALACRQMVPANLEAFENVAVVKVERSEAVPNDSLHLWKISATLGQVIKGASPSSVNFTGVIGSNGCENRKPMPGDQWVVYSGGGLPAEEYPLGQVLMLDPRLEGVRP